MQFVFVLAAVAALSANPPLEIYGCSPNGRTVYQVNPGRRAVGAYRISGRMASSADVCTALVRSPRLNQVWIASTSRTGSHSLRSIMLGKHGRFGYGQLIRLPWLARDLHINSDGTRLYGVSSDGDAVWFAASKADRVGKAIPRHPDSSGSVSGSLLLHDETLVIAEHSSFVHIVEESHLGGVEFLSTRSKRRSWFPSSGTLSVWKRPGANEVWALEYDGSIDRFMRSTDGAWRLAASQRVSAAWAKPENGAQGSAILHAAFSSDGKTLILVDVANALHAFRVLANGALDEAHGLESGRLAEFGDIKSIAPLGGNRLLVRVVEGSMSRLLILQLGADGVIKEVGKIGLPQNETVWTAGF